MILRLAGFAFAMLLAGWAVPGRTQTFTVSSISISDFGNIVAANTGLTTFRAAAETGVVTRISGTGTRLSTTAVRALVTIACGDQSACKNANAQVHITITGTPTGRAAALQNFTVSVSGATATIATAPGTGDNITFMVGPVGRNSTKTFWVGFDLPINGNNSAAATGIAVSSLVVTASRTDGTTPNSLAGSTGANVFRALSIASSSNLAFGRISRPVSGTGTVSLAPVTGVVSVSGNGVQALGSPSPTAAAFAISGEGGQSISVSVPSSFVMTGASGSITVTTNPTLNGAQVLGGSLGNAGSLSLSVGGTFPLTATTPAQSFSGSLAVTVQYN